MQATDNTDHKPSALDTLAGGSRAANCHEQPGMEVGCHRHVAARICLVGLGLWLLHTGFDLHPFRLFSIKGTLHVLIQAAPEVFEGHWLLQRFSGQ